MEANIESGLRCPRAVTLLSEERRRLDVVSPDSTVRIRQFVDVTRLGKLGLGPQSVDRPGSTTFILMHDPLREYSMLIL